MHTLQAVLDRFPAKHVVVVGDAVLDRYIIGKTERLCREGPAPVLEPRSRVESAGGAANVAINARALGAAVTFISLLGDDAQAGVLESILSQAGVAAVWVREKNRLTPTKTRFLAEQQILLRLDEGGDSRPAARSLLQDSQARAALRAADLIILSDYGLGVFDSRMKTELVHWSRETRKPLAADSRTDIASFSSLRPLLVKPNFSEALAALGSAGPFSGGRADYICGRAERLLNLTAAEIVAVTLDKEGAVLLERDRPPRAFHAIPESHSQAAGAGDTYLAAMGLGLICGASSAQAGELAALAAQIVVHRAGTSICSRDELSLELEGAGKMLEGREKIESLVRKLRAENKRIVFTNGCFDMLHAGSISLIKRAKQLGDVLIVGLNGDESIRRLKGRGRPVNRLRDRIKIVGALNCVDYLVAFTEDTACRLIELIRPDIFVKGAAHAGSSLPERPVVEQLGGAFVVLPVVDAASTSSLVQGIRNEVRLGLEAAG